jgi:hypothetical protein
MSPELLAALKASLADPAKAWEVIGVSLADGEAASTFQLQSSVLGLTIVVTHETAWPEFKLRIFANGFAYTAEDEDLYYLIEAMAIPASIEAEAELIAQLNSGESPTEVELTATGVTSEAAVGAPVLFGPDGIRCP